VILGIGTDICHTERIRRSLETFGDDWINELFTTEEHTLCQLGADHALLFARAFCGKEACLKALGIGITEDIGWHDVEILQLGPSASVRLSGGALQRLQGMTPAGQMAVIHLACAGAELAQATVTISTVSIS
jgi:holo-[acyl-carrier protein] synthase